MENNQHSPDKPAASFFSTLPGIITAIAGLITALGGFILILNKAGCMSARTDAGQITEQNISSNSSEGRVNKTDSAKINGFSTTGNVAYSPGEVKIVLKQVLFKVLSANIQPLSADQILFNLKLKCINESKYEYHFYSHNVRVRIGEDSYVTDPGSPNESYESVPAYGFKNLEYNYKLPAGAKAFQLVFFDEKEEVGSVRVSVK